MTTSRTWLVLFINSEVLRRYQWPVSVERVLADHRAAVAALPISEGMDTSAAPIEAPAGCAQAGEGHAALRVPSRRPACTGCSRGTETKFSGLPSSCLLQLSCMKTIKLQNRSLGASGGSNPPCIRPLWTGPAMLPDLNADLQEQS